MAWDTILTTFVRHLINDLEDVGDVEYDDARIQQSIVIAGVLSSQDYEFSTTYTFDIDDISISPDPTLTTTYDALAISLFTLKSACILETNRYQKALKEGQGVMIKDGDTQVDMRNQLTGYKDLLAVGPCVAYQNLLKDKEFKNSMNRGKAVMSPFVHDDSSHNHAFFGRNVASFFDSLLRR